MNNSQTPNNNPKNDEPTQDHTKSPEEIAETISQEELEKSLKEVYTRLTKTTQEILEMKETKVYIDKIAEKLGDETAKNIQEFISLVMVASAWSTLYDYDQSLLEPFNAQYRKLVDVINEMRADIDGMLAVMNVFKKDLNDVKQKIILDDVKNDMTPKG